MLELRATKRRRELTLGALQLGALLIVLILGNEASIANCEAKEFDWGDLGVSLANAKPSLGGGIGSAGSSNLRILVSPQRRQSKGYEFDYASNSSQSGVGGSSSSSGSGDGSSGPYMVSSSNSPYLGQSVYQLSPNHSSAYSALSASLATLKNRLSARGVSLTSTLGGGGGISSSDPASHQLYSTNVSGAYGPSVQLLDPAQQQAQQQAQPLSLQNQQQQQQSQPTYLSVSSNQQGDPQSPLGAYTVPPSQGSEGNKTIVLAIPAKINFLTGASSKQQQQQHQLQQQQQQQQQQGPASLQLQHHHLNQQPLVQQQQGPQPLGLLQAPGDAGLDQQGQLMPGEPQGEHQPQYVIVNQHPSQLQVPTSDHHSHSVAASLSPSAVNAQGQAVYSTAIYQPATLQHTPAGYAMKYLPTYAQPAAVPAGPQLVQKVYSVIEPQPLQQQQQQQQQTAPLASYEPAQMADAQSQASPSRYSTCLDTCNSSDPRWRKYTVSKYKACCSRSSHFDASLEQPSAEKVSELSSRYADDAYYNYLYRKSRARRSRRHRNRSGSSNSYYSSSRYPSGSSASSSSSSQQGPPAAEEGEYPDSERLPASSSSGGRAYHEPAYGSSSSSSKGAYYKASRGYSSGSSSAAASEGAEPQAPEQLSGSSVGKYLSKERAYRRSRSRDYLDGPMLGSGEAQVQAAAAAAGATGSQPGDNVEDDSVYPREPASQATKEYVRGPPPPPPASYGGGEFSVDLQGRGYGSDSARAPLNEEDDQTRFDEPNSGELEGSKGGESDYLGDGQADSGDDSEMETPSASYRYTSGNTRVRKAKQVGAKSRRKYANKEQKSTYYKKSRKANKSKSGSEHHLSNGTDYESAQPGDYNGYQQDSQAGQGSAAGDQSAEDHTQFPGKESSGYEGTESEKDGVLSKYRANLNDSAVANLSKTTMHLKEILSILEKKAQSRGNDSLLGPNSQQQSLPVTTSTQVPITTTTSYPLSSLLSGSPYSSSLSSGDFLSSDFSSLKSPYRFDPTSFSTGPLGSSSLSLPSSFGSFGSDALSLPPPPPPPYPSAYALHAGKHLGANPNGPHQRKRRPSKSTRYNELMFQKAAHGLVTPSSLMLAKNRLLNPAYAASLQYPYMFRGNSPAITNPYPYKNHHKNPYSALLNGPVSSKLAAAAAASSGSGLYTEESRLHGLSSLDPLANMGSSLKPSAAMRLRSKPFIFQPQVMPIYTRHTILSPFETKAAAAAKA